MLRACNRLLRPGGRIAYYTIFVTPGLSPAEFRRALRAGPPAVASRRRTESEMLRSAGFVDVREVDATAEFLRTTRAWLRSRLRRAAELSEAEGEAAFKDRQRHYRLESKAIAAGLLRRSLFLAERTR